MYFGACWVLAGVRMTRLTRNRIIPRWLYSMRIVPFLSFQLPAGWWVKYTVVDVFYSDLLLLPDNRRNKLAPNTTCNLFALQTDNICTQQWVQRERLQCLYLSTDISTYFAASSLCEKIEKDFGQTCNIWRVETMSQSCEQMSVTCTLSWWNNWPGTSTGWRQVHSE